MTVAVKPKRKKRRFSGRAIFYKRDFKQPPFRLTLEWDGGPCDKIEQLLYRLCRKHHGSFEGAGTLIAEPLRRDYSVTFNKRNDYLAFRNYLVEQPVFVSILQESESLLLKMEAQP